MPTVQGFLFAKGRVFHFQPNTKEIHQAHETAQRLNISKCLPLVILLKIVGKFNDPSAISDFVTKFKAHSFIRITNTICRSFIANLTCDRRISFGG